ncbi:MAG: hypothetical protein AAF846_19305 [Chloroflexota bacterium]
MSDKYFVSDYNSYTHCCQNTYRAECRDSEAKIDTVVAKDETKVSGKKSLKWWQRLWEHDTQRASS